MLNIITQSASLIGMRDKNEDELDIINKTFKKVFHQRLL